MSENWVHTTSTGFTQRIDDTRDKIPEYDPRSGDHFWVMITTFRCDPKRAMKGDALMDSETLVNVAGPLCFYCEQIYTDQLYHRRCKGEPKF